MTPDEERWAEALAIERFFGEQAPLWVAEQIGAAINDGDDARSERFLAIAAKFELLLAGQRP